LVLDVQSPYLSFADIAWLAFYPLVYAGLMRLPSARGISRSSETIFLLDGLLMATAGAAMGWEFIMFPVVDPATTTLASIAIFAYPVIDLLLLGAFGSLALSTARRTIPRGTVWVIASLAVMLLADTAWARMTIADTYATGVWVDVLWPLSYALFGVAALVYVKGRAAGHMVERRTPASLARAGAGLGGLIHSYSAWLALAAVGVVSYNHFVTHNGSSLGGNTATVVMITLLPVLVLARQLIFSTQNHRLQASLVEVSEELEERVRLRTQELAEEKERLSILNQAAREISQCTSVQEVLNVGARFLARATRCSSVAVSAPGQRGSLRFALTGEAPETGQNQLRRVLRRFLLSNADRTDETPVLLDARDMQNLESGATAGANGGFRNMMLFPVVSRQVMLGAACLASDSDDCHLSQEESEVIRNVVSQLAVALEGACRYDDARYLADNDALTGLRNRRCVIDRLEREVARAERITSNLALVMMDVDKFKFFNDTYGHEIGDQVLIAVASGLQEAVRGIDVLGRFGGDEFLAILPDTDREGALRVVARIQSCLANRPVMVEGASPLALHLSCGIAVYPKDGRNPRELFHVADSNMYQAKHGRSNRSAAVRV
ncbi:MAG: sensor domain-containing diguanylate cyclase, partial [Thermoleophilia bacterium]|nr:sensor domain-containing diguanylate cyclase [Thermoleophilia bacterium]